MSILSTVGTDLLGSCICVGVTVNSDFPSLQPAARRVRRFFCTGM